MYEKLWEKVSLRSGQVQVPQRAHQSSFPKGKSSNPSDLVTDVCVLWVN